MADGAEVALGRRGLFRGESAPVASAAYVAGVSPQCFAFRGIACMSCRDACASGAVRFKLAPGGAVPWIDSEICTGCGDCQAVCPASAISVVAAARALPDA
jgi:ferredoxin-type protein NapF